VRFGSDPRSVLAALTFVLGVFWPALAPAQVVRKDFYVTNGPVYATVLVGNTLYLGGSFSQLGPSTGGGIPVDTATAAVVTGFPRVSANGVPSAVNAVVSDGAGGWYIGGSFTTVGDVPRANLAHVLANNTVSDWNPGTDLPVYCLARIGSVVYVGGSFFHIGGIPIGYLAAVDATSGAVNTSWVTQPSSTVQALAVSGSTLYVGGSFVNILGDTTAKYVAALDTTGFGNFAGNWDPPIAHADGPVFALAVGASALYVGGHFTSAGGQSRIDVAALDADTGHALAGWNANVNGDVLALAVAGSRVYAGGMFSKVGAQFRDGFVSLDPTTGLLTGPNWRGQTPVRAIAVSASVVYVGGDFGSMGGAARNRIAALDPATGNATAWNPSVASASVFALSLGAGTSNVFVGGSFTSLGGVLRNNLAAVDVPSGVPTGWNPNANGPVFALAARGTTIYAGGAFDTVNGLQQQRLFAAAMDASTGALTPWNPRASDPVLALAAAQATDRPIYAGGKFGSIGGATRSRIAALDPITGTATTWNPGVSRASLPIFVSSVAIGGSNVYVGGLFDQVGLAGTPRNNLAAIDSSTALATPWNPNVNNEVNALALSGSTVYAGGKFTTVHLLARNHIVALDTLGVPTGWNPSANSDVLGLAVSGNAVYAGGLFTTIGGQARSLLADVDATTGTATPWNPAANDSVRSVSVSGSTVYTGGVFTALGSVAQGVAAITASCSAPGGVGSTSPTLTGPRVAVSGDFDGDGQLDVALVVANGAQVLRNARGGQFTSLAAITTGGTGRGIASADFNADGVLDLAVSTSSGLYVMLGTSSNGVPTGGFGPPTPYAVGGANPAGIAVADVNADGINDLVVAVTGANKVAVLLGQGATAIGVGNGTFGPPTLYPPSGAPLSAPLTLVLADLNGDGILDLAVTNSGGTTVSVMLGRGTGGAANGTFGPATNVTVAAAPGPLVTGDFNEDFITDLAVGRTGGVDVLLGNGAAGVGNGTFAPAMNYGLVNPGASVLSLVVADFDSDGRADLGAALDDGTMAYLYGDGANTSGNGRFLLGPVVNVGGNLSGLDVDAFDSTAVGPTPIVAQSDQNQLVALNGVCSSGVGRTLELLSPNGGEELDKDSNVPIQWTRGPLVTAVNVDISRDNGAHWERLASNQTRSQYVWHVTPPGATQARVRIVDANMYTLSDASNGSFTLMPLLAVPPSALPARPSFSLACPNPSPGSVRFTLRLPAEAAVTIEVFDLAGRGVRTLARGLLSPGDHALLWDGRGSDGSRAASGIYFVRARAPGLEAVRRVVRIE
jgi:hypothetical protein